MAVSGQQAAPLTVGGMRVLVVKRDSGAIAQHPLQHLSLKNSKKLRKNPYHIGGEERGIK